MIKTCRFLSSKAASLGSLEKVQVSVNMLRLVRPTSTSRHFCQLPERGGHRFEPKNHVSNTSLSLTKHRTLAK